MPGNLAAFRPGMELGMGYDSFTDILKVKHAVQTPNGPISTAPTPSANATIRQKVKYISKRVEKIKDVMDCMDISGALRVKTIFGQGGDGAAGFINVDSFTESDINLFIQVRVENEMVSPDNLDVFIPCAGLTETTLSEWYGDSYISGYIEGGTFNAIISIQVDHKDKRRDMGGDLDIDVDLKGFEVKGDIQGDLGKLQTAYNGHTSISVAYEGGGQVVGGGEWTLEALKAAAAGFPDRVAAVPIRTHVIFTQYTQLRSFLELSLGQNNLDYDFARSCINTMLDAYVEYQNILKELQHMRPTPLVLSNGTSYTSDAKGLSAANKDCISEMALIVANVRKVEKDPKSAGTGSWLSPAEFRIKLPTDPVKIDDLQQQLTQARLTMSNLEQQVAQPYGGYCPVPLDREVSFHNSKTFQALDHCIANCKLQTWGCTDDIAQSWIISRAPNGGFHIKTACYDRFIALDTFQGARPTRQLKLTDNKADAATVFFEAQAGGPIGCPEIFIVRFYGLDDSTYTLAPYEGQVSHGTRVVMSSCRYKSLADRWRIFPNLWNTSYSPEGLAFIESLGHKS